MFDSTEQTAALDYNLAKITARGATIVAAAGDGGSHFSFEFFPGDAVGSVLNEVSCAHGSVPTYPSSSPWVLSVGGSQWGGASPSAPVAWNSGGSGFSSKFARPAYQAGVVAAYLMANANSSGFPALSGFNSQ